MVGSTTGWLLAAVFLALAVSQYGWRGAVLAGTVTAFWMLLQFGRALRTLRNASRRPKGQIDSVTLLASKLRKGMTLAQVLALSKCFGHRCEAAPNEERWRWVEAAAGGTDGIADGGAGNDAITLRLVGGRLVAWSRESEHVAE